MLLTHQKVAFVKRDPVGYNAVRADGSAHRTGGRGGCRERTRSGRQTADHGRKRPLEVIEQTLGTSTIAVPIADYDDNQHSANENILLHNLWDAIETMAALETMKYRGRIPGVASLREVQTSGTFASHNFCKRASEHCCMKASDHCGHGWGPERRSHLLGRRVLRRAGDA
jgi:hypothetical protein